MSFLFMQPLLILVVFLIVAFAVSLLLPARRVKAIRVFALSVSLVALFLGLFTCAIFDQSADFQFLFRLDIAPLYNLSFTLGADGISIVFLLLTLFVFPLCFLASWTNAISNTKHFFCFLLSMELLLVVTFTTLDVFYFYVFFESLLIPMFIIIGIWGARERKIKAANYFFIYTLFGSLFMLFGIFYIFLITGSTNYFVLLNTTFELSQQRLLWLCLFFAFAVKMPLFPFHIWLPEAHVEAPTVGSMLLASLLLKLGGYGFIRFSLSMFAAGYSFYAPVVFTFSLLGVIYGSLSTIRQIDLKRIIAYSSVAHMNLVMLGLFSESMQGIEGAIYLMVGHGVVSPALFFCVGVVYDRYHTRLLRYYGGLVTVMPLFTTGLFAFTLANMSFPGTSNFLGELLLFLGLFAKDSTVLLLSSTGIVLSAVYSIWLFNRVAFGTLKTRHISRFSDLTKRETVVLFFFLVAMIFLGFNSDFVLNFTHLPVKKILISAGLL